MITPVVSVKFYTSSATPIGFVSAIMAANCIKTMPAALSEFFLSRNKLKNIKHSVIITKCCEKTKTIGNLSCQNICDYTSIACEYHSYKRMKSVYCVPLCCSHIVILFGFKYRIPIGKLLITSSFYCNISIILF